ncbi:MAG: YggS family pyridoxal phosphate-dependent enzyme [Eubacterium sp.]|nr:YggS family pyridoxal phosphate-dependent enzyme [Eubacterium sp.]
MLETNLKKVRERIEAACRRAGRDPEEVTLLAVSKRKPLSDIETLLALGQKDFGENYVQELLDKEEKVTEPVRWHMIGHLQTNKVRQIVGKTALIHSVDSVRLAERIEREAGKRDLSADILIQVNVAHEDSKFGLDTGQTEELIRKISTFPHVRVRGLMTSAPFVEDPEKNRCYFRKLHKLFVDIGSKNIDNVSMDILSMGMTNDYEVAIEEGATMVRIGTAIFGARE